MSWFSRHLNWTLVLSWIFALLLMSTFGSKFWLGFDSVSVQVSPAISSETVGEWVEGIRWLGAPAVVLAVTAWCLRKKNRSLLHLFWYLLFIYGIGGIILLCLKNRSEQQVTG